MGCLEFLSKLLADFVYLQYKFHTLHTDMGKSPIFMPIHSLMDEVYQFFGDDNIDWIKERCRILGAYSPTSIFELSKLTQVKELNGPCPAMPELLHVVASDLRTMEGMLENGIQFTGKMGDLVTQNQMINYADAVGKFRRKIESSIPNEVLPIKSTK